MNSHNRVSKYLNFMYFMSLTKQSKLRYITIGVVSNCSTRNGFATSDINELSCKVYLNRFIFCCAESEIIRIKNRNDRRLAYLLFGIFNFSNSSFSVHYNFSS